MNGKFYNLTSGENLTLQKVLHLINLFAMKTDSLLNGRKCNTERLNYLTTYLKMISLEKLTTTLYILFSNKVYKLARW